MKYIKRCLKIAEYVLAAVLIGITIFAVIMYAQGIQPIYVVSDNPSSMSPTINYGDAFIVYPIDFNSLQLGDIVVFNDPRDNPLTIVHRIQEVNDSDIGRYVITKGDNNQTNPTEDPWNLTSQHYLAKVLFVVPCLGYLSPALWGFSGPTFIVLAVSLIVVVFGIKYFVTKTKNKCQEVPA